MEKLLTVSVAAYNGAATLQKALESCLVADESLQALLDVIITVSYTHLTLPTTERV